MAIEPFKISIPDSELTLLHQKLLHARLPRSLLAAKWTESGRNDLSIELMESVLSFWLSEYSWRAEESLMNRLPQFTTSIPISGFDDIHLHFIHSRSSTTSGTPLLFLHGWPGSFHEITKALALLNDSSFHVVAPSLPGWAFSSYPDQAGFKLIHCAQITHELMWKLGYKRYVVQGGDWGANIGRVLAILQPGNVIGLHLNNVDMDMPEFETAPEYTPFEKRQIANHKQWHEHETGYFSIQSTKPLTLGIALHDSPVGLLSWFIDKILVWSDSWPRNPRGYKWSHTELITWTLLHYFANDGPTTSLAMYAENDLGDVGVGGKYFVEVPTGVSAFAGEAEMVPRSWAETKANVVWWREHELGGHFAMYERPKEMAEDVTAFVKQILGTGHETKNYRENQSL